MTSRFRSNRAPNSLQPRPQVDARARNLGFDHALLSSGHGAKRLGVVTRAKGDGKLQGELNDARKQVDDVSKQLGEAQQQLNSSNEELNVARRDLEQARKEAREAEELFAAAADERAAKVKELVQEIDHWHDAATLAQQMEQEARSELEDARRQLNETGGRADEAQRSKEGAEHAAEENRRRVEDLERARDEANQRYEKAKEDVRLQDVELDRLRNELEQLRGELNGARGELEKWANEVAQESAKGGADAMMELERLKNKHEEDKQRWKRAAASTEEALLRDKDKGLQSMQGALADAEHRAKEAEEGRKRAEESTRLFSEQHGHKVKELEEKCAELQDRAEKKEWYLGEARADLERAKEELEAASGVSDEVAAELAAAKEATLAAEKVITERDLELVTAREELTEARSMLEAVADGVESATMEAANRMKKADERVREVHTSKAEADAELERLRNELEEARQRTTEAEEAAERRVDDAKGRTDEAWAAAEEKGRALEHAQKEFDEYKEQVFAKQDEANLRVHQAEHRAESLKTAIEQKERDAGRLREDLAAARDAAYEGGNAGSSEATERALRAEERASATADEARSAAISAQEKLEMAKRLEQDARAPEVTAREATERLNEAEGKVEQTERGVAEKAEELKQARGELSTARQETAEVAREFAKLAETANERVLAADAATRRAESELARFQRDLDSIAGEIRRSNERGDTEVANALEGHQQQGFEARDAKKGQIEGLRHEANNARSDARDAARDAYSRTDEGQRRVKECKQRVDFLANDVADGKIALEKYRDECARLAAVRDEAARASLKAETACFSSARDAADSASHAVEKMRVSEVAAAKAYDMAASRERVLRDEIEKAGDHGHHSSGSGVSEELQRRVQDAKNTAEWAAGLEEQRKAQEAKVESAKLKLSSTEDRARELLRESGDAYGEFGRMTEALENTKRIAAEAAKVEEARRVAAVASVDASHKLRVATERLQEMQGKMGKKERDFSDAERDMESARREAESAVRESEEAKAVERRLTEEQGGMGGMGGNSNNSGGFGSSQNEARAKYENARDELSAMRGQLEEAKHTVMRAEELEQLRRTANEAFERSAREKAANMGSSAGFGGGSSMSSMSTNQQQVSDPRGVPTQQQLESRESELCEMRGQLDVLGNTVKHNIQRYENVYAALQNASDHEREFLSSEAQRVHGELEASKTEAEEFKASVARLEAHVGEMKSVMAQASGGGSQSSFGSPQHEAPVRTQDRGGDEGYDPENDNRSNRGMSSHTSSQQSYQTSSQFSSQNEIGPDEADRRAAQLALEEAEYVSREAKRRAREIRNAFNEKERGLEQMKRVIERSGNGGVYGGGGNDGYNTQSSDTEEKRRQALVTAAEASFRAKQADERAKGIHNALDERRRELEWMRGQIETAQRELEPTRRAAEEAAEKERAADARAAQIRLGGDGMSNNSVRGRDEHPVDGHRQREAREAAEQAKRDYEWVLGELTAMADEASRAARERDSAIESLELSLAGVETGPLEARYNAEDTATASFRIRQIEDRARRKTDEESRSMGVPKREDLEHARSKAMASASAAESAREKTSRAETMAHEASVLADTVAARCKVAEETAEHMRVAANEAASRRERLLQEELQAAATAAREGYEKIETLEQMVADLETRGRELASVSRVAAAEARLAETDARDAAASAAAESQAMAKRLEGALHRAERELAAMEQAMVEELTSTEVRLMETSEESGSRAEAMEKMRRELMVEREKANLAMNEAKIQEARAHSARAEAETALAWQEGAPIGERSLLVDDEVYELRRKIDELELTLAEVMTHGPESTVGDRATGKLMQHIQALQEKVREGREIRAMSETMLAEQALLREQAEEAKFYMAEAEAKAKEYEEMSGKLWGALDRAGIDVEQTVQRPQPRQRPVFVSGLSISQGGQGLDPEVEAIQRKLMEADEDLTELMNEIMTDMVKVETEVARKELDAARAEAEELRKRLADRGYQGGQ